MGPLSRRMIRVLLVLVAVLVAALAFAFDRSWLYVVAAVPLIGALVLLGRQFWAAFQRERRRNGIPSDMEGEDSLEDLGIMNVRPQEEKDDGTGTSDESVSAGAGTEAETTSETESARDKSSKEWPESGLSDEDHPSPDTTAQEASVHSDDRPVLSPFLESLRAALGAQTVCLLKQEEVILEYQIEALASVQPGAQRAGTFETESPLLTATMSRQPVTVRSLDGDDRQDLRYYEHVPPITQVAVAPISRPDSPCTVFLLVDSTAEVDLGNSQARSLLEQYAETVGELLDIEDQGVNGAAAHPQQSAQPDGEVEAPETEEEGAPRPRREIIAEEMEAADAASENLALVLVHLNRAESIARRGEEAVRSAERHLSSRLKDLAAGQRVERFGELTYGIFVRSGVGAVEEWAADLQEAMAKETGELEGGVSVGVAVRDARHDPEQLRADATEALLEAYETGTCTIIG